ncbi:MAG: hypothetical protein WCG97_03500 [bacterium]
MNTNHTRNPIDWNKYLMTFFITAVIFGGALYINNLLDKSRSNDIRSIQDTISLNILSSETQYNLLSETSCKNVNDSILSSELNSLEQKLSYLESSDPSQNSAEFNYIKKYYELLQIKDFSLMQRLTDKCGLKPISILYFYGSKDDCSDCEKTSVVLNYLRNQYPNIRIYSFDRRLSVSAVDTLAKIYKVQAPYPVLVINDEAYNGYKSIDDMKNILPELKKIDKERLTAGSKNSSTENSTTTLK